MLVNFSVPVWISAIQRNTRKKKSELGRISSRVLVEYVFIKTETISSSVFITDRRKRRCFEFYSTSLSIEELRIFYLRYLFRRCVFVIHAEDFFQSTRGDLTSVEFFLRMNNFISNLVEFAPFWHFMLIGYTKWVRHSVVKMSYINGKNKKRTQLKRKYGYIKCWIYTIWSWALHIYLVLI